MPLTFDAERHVYDLDGRALPGITAILRAGGLVESRAWDDAAALRGTYVHEATELYDRDTLDEADLAPELKPYLDAWKKAKAEMGFEIVEIEALYGSGPLGYATKIDRVVEWRGRIAVINLKTGNKYPHYPIQLAGEARLMDDWREVSRLAVYLNDQGTYKVEQYTDPNDFAVFLACLQIHHWKETA